VTIPKAENLKKVKITDADLVTFNNIYLNEPLTNLGFYEYN
jgi:hypothetical protein